MASKLGSGLMPEFELSEEQFIKKIVKIRMGKFFIKILQKNFWTKLDLQMNWSSVL